MGARKDDFQRCKEVTETAGRSPLVTPTDMDEDSNLSSDLSDG
jgi:hypothetical protein